MSPSINHSYLCRKLILLIEQTQQWEAWPELSLDIETGLIPDIAIFPIGKLKPDFHKDSTKANILPEIVIEILSPSQSIHELMQKAEKFLQAGIQQVWTIEPYGKIVYISQPENREVKISGQLVFHDLQLDLQQLFS